MAAALLVLCTAMLEIASLIFLMPLLSMSRGSNAEQQPLLMRWLNPWVTTMGFNNLLIACVVTLGLLSTLSQFSTVLHRKIAYLFVGRLRRRLLTALLGARWAFVTGLKSSEVTHVLTTATVYLVVGVQQLWQLLTGCVMIAVYGVMCLVWSPQITLLAIFGLMLPLVVGKLRRKSSADLRHQHAAASLSFDAVVADSLASVRWAKLHGTTQHVFDEMEHTLEAHAAADLALTRHNSGSRVIQAAWGAVMMGALLYLALVRLQLPLAQIVVLMFVLFRLWPRVGSLMTVYHQIDHALPFMDETLKLTRRIQAAAETAISGSRLGRIPLQREIELRDVSFRYGVEDASQLLTEPGSMIENIDVVIKANSITALMGPSGSGKSTLLDLVAGLLQPQSGAVLVDGQALVSEDLVLWRRTIACVGAESPLFHTSLRDNLCMGGTVATDGEIRAALQVAEAAEFVLRLPAGLDTLIGDRGTRLSAGERQRICIARAVLQNPKLLILDEATGALDSETESRIFRQLRAWLGNRTILIVSHRDTVHQFADQVLELRAGKVIAAKRVAAVPSPRLLYGQFV